LYSKHDNIFHQEKKENMKTDSIQFIFIQHFNCIKHYHIHSNTVHVNKTDYASVSLALEK